MISSRVVRWYITLIYVPSVVRWEGVVSTVGYSKHTARALNALMREMNFEMPVPSRPPTCEKYNALSRSLSALFTRLVACCLSIICLYEYNTFALRLVCVCVFQKQTCPHLLKPYIRKGRTLENALQYHQLCHFGIHYRPPAKKPEMPPNWPPTKPNCGPT